MRILKSIVGIAFVALLGVGCSGSNGDDVAGIEIGNPALALTADFSVDYDKVESKTLAKSAAKNEPMLLDSFSMDLIEVRSYSSYYVAVSINPSDGVPVWPYESGPDTSISISFTEGSSVVDPFSNINLQDEGYLKEIGVSFKPAKSKSTISGRILVGKTYVPFEYSLDGFQKIGVRYHFSQIERVSDTLVNLSVAFHVRYFVDGLDFSEAEISDDGIIYFDNDNNASLWNELNARFVPSFRPLRYSTVNDHGDESEDYVKDIWDGIIGSMSENTIENGDFSNGMNGWIFFKQLNGDAVATVKEEKNGEHILQVEVTNPGLKSYSVQLIQEDVALVAGKKYKCVFTIWADVEGEITARIGTYDDYETVGFQKHVKVGTTGKAIEIEFSPIESTPFARFELNLGNMYRTFYIKDVKIYRLEE